MRFVLALLLFCVSCSAENYEKTTLHSEDGKFAPKITHFAVTSEKGDIKCDTYNGVGLTELSVECHEIKKAQGFLQEVAVVSGAASAACWFIPEPTYSKGLAVGFRVTSGASLFVSYLVGKIPCKESFTKEEAEQIQKIVKAQLKKDGIEVEGNLDIPLKKD